MQFLIETVDRLVHLAKPKFLERISTH